LVAQNHRDRLKKGRLSPLDVIKIASARARDGPLDHDEVTGSGGEIDVLMSRQMTKEDGLSLTGRHPLKATPS